MNTPDYTADHLEYLVNNGWTLNVAVTRYHLLTRPGFYIVIEPTGYLQLFQFNDLNRSYDYIREYWDTRPLPLKKFAMLCDVMDLANVAENLSNIFVKS